MAASLTKLPVVLSAMHVDVTSRIGAQAPTTPTGLPRLDELLLGGWRRGDVVAISGPIGAGKTSLALHLAYVAARARAGALFASAVHEETEIFARLSARAIHRAHPDSRVHYGRILTGQALEDASERALVTQALDTVLKNVGGALSLLRPPPLASTEVLVRAAEQLWSQRERTVVVIDGMESLTAQARGQAALAAAVNSSMTARLCQVVLELRALAEQGAAVIFTLPEPWLPLVSPSCSHVLRLEPPSATGAEPAQAAEALKLSLQLLKNTRGPSAAVALRAQFGAGLLEVW